ncbi:MAG: N-acetyltransferase [Gemmatimonadota bacterium]
MEVPREAQPSGDGEAAARLDVRAGVPADAGEIEAVHWAGLEAAYVGRVRGWPEVPRDVPARTARWRSWLADPEIDVVVGRVGGVVVGFCALRPCPDPDLDGNVGEIATLYVHPDHWSHGYGTDLCLASVGRGVERGFDAIVLWVVDVNERARRFYRYLGFAPDGARKLTEHSAEPLAARRYRMQLGGGAARAPAP